MSEQELEQPADELATTAIETADLVVRSHERREIEARIVPWGDVIDSPIGLETFLPGSFGHVDPKRVVLRLEHQDPPAGRGIALEERSDGAYMTFRVSKTPRGDEILTLAADGVTERVSVGYSRAGTESELQTRAGRRVTAHRKVDLREVSTTWKPYYERAAVLSVRSTNGGPAVAETQEATATVAPEPAVPAQVQIDLAPLEAAFTSFADKIEDRMHALEERSRSEIVIPGAKPDKPEIHKGQWTQAALKILTGERIADMQLRALADLITTDNAGVVPEAFLNELIGVIDPRRPFLNSTRRLETPDAGMTLNVPVIATRPTAGVQVNEKDDIVSTATSITNSGFDAVTIAGGGDISLQLLKRSSPSYLSLYLELLAEALADNAEAEAVAALIAAGVTPGTGTFDPEDIKIGEAWTNAQAQKQRADTMWLSSAAVAEFLDAKDNGTNRPLFVNLGGGFSVSDGAEGGSTVTLRPVFVPALDATAVDVLIGPSRGFGWAEDGAFTLQVDVPAKAGRDVALVTIDWFAPLYPDAFTSYGL